MRSKTDGRNERLTVSRRTFCVAGISAAGGLLVTLVVPRRAAGTQAQGQARAVSPPAAFIEIRPDGKIIVQVNRVEFGQGVATALPLVLAEELDADWSQITPRLAPAADAYKDPLFGIQMVGGSGSIAHSFTQYRELGARVRAMLVSAAARRWNTTPDQCRTEGSVVHGPGGQTLRYAEVAVAAARLPVPQTVQLKDPAQFRLIGKPTRRLDSRAKGDGSLKFGIDLDLPGMLVALVAHPPTFGGRVRTLNAAAARAVPGVTQVIQIPTDHGGTAVAVVARGFWAARQARNRLRIEWDAPAGPAPDSARLLTEYQTLARQRGRVSVSRGDVSALDRSPDRLQAEYAFPFLAHSPMEPLNATVRFSAPRAEAWVPSQFQTVDQQAIAEVLGVKPEQVTFHTEYAGGGFGRRATPDSHLVREAAEIAKRVPGVPVKLIWTREDDVRGGYYRPMHVHRVEVTTGADGLPTAWRHVIVGQSILAGTPFAAMMVKDGIDAVTVEGVADTHYRIPGFELTVHHPESRVPVLWWRSVGHTHNAYVMETLVDELATRAGADPFEYRRRLLAPDAHKLRTALDLLDRQTAWRSQLPAGHAAGLALHESFDTAVGCLAEVSVVRGRPRIHRVTAAANLGIAVNPLTIESQIQGGLVFGISQLVPGGEITLREGRVVQRNFDDYRPPYMLDAPAAIDVHIVPSTEAPTGVGEPGTPPMAPAVANALARITGKRYYTLPLGELT
jgi:isoquinoline 1-oxidoreductase beta subunit